MRETWEERIGCSETWERGVGRGEGDIYTQRQPVLGWLYAMYCCGCEHLCDRGHISSVVIPLRDVGNQRLELSPRAGKLGRV